MAEFSLDGKVWPSVEHYFHAKKFPGDPVLQEKIRTAATPLGAKRLGRTRSEHFVSNWDEIREQVMREGLHAKFSQNPALKEMLLNTGKMQLREANRTDDYWGTGRCGCGRNRMGTLLMQIRFDLRGQN